MVDISFFGEDAFALDELARKKGVTAIVDCGVAPGLCNIIAGYVTEKMDQVEGNDHPQKDNQKNNMSSKFIDKGAKMPILNIEGVGEFEIPAGTRLVNALEDNGGDPLHRCGGNARCTTCRVEFLAGEPDSMTKAEKEKLESMKEGLGSFRLSCQCTVDHDMHVKVLMPYSESGLDNPGARPEDQVTP